MNKVFSIGGRAYNVPAPTIKNVSLATQAMGEVPEGCKDLTELFNGMEKKALCKALSYLIQGDESLSEELSFGTREELSTALESVYADVLKSLKRVTALASGVCALTVKPKE